MLASANRLETDEGHLHTSQCADSIPRRISHIKAAAETTHENEYKRMKWDHVRDEGVAACNVELR